MLNAGEETRGDMFVSLFCNFPTGPNLLSYCKILPTAHIYPFGPTNPTFFPKKSAKSYIFS